MRKSDHGRAAPRRSESQVGVGAAIDRITHGEGAISELKRHGAGRARCRGTRKLHLQLLLAATAINLKRLITRDPAAENTAAGRETPERARIATQHQATGHDHRARAAITAHLQIIQTCLTALVDGASPLLRQAPRGAAPLPRERRHSGQLAASDTSACVALFLLSSTLPSKPSVTPKIPWPTHHSSAAPRYRACGSFAC